MGSELTKSTFTPAEVKEFDTRVERQHQLYQDLVFGDPHFGTGPTTIGHEVEAVIIDEQCRPLYVNAPVLETLLREDHTVVPEIMQHLIENNSAVHPLAGKPFSAFTEETKVFLDAALRAAASHGGQIGLIGILPTMMPRDAVPENFSANPRYLALDAGLRDIGETFTFSCFQDPRIAHKGTSVAEEGLNTSLQPHLSTSPANFVDTYNAAQLAAAIALAASPNSPYIYGHRGWQESRVHVFEETTRGRCYWEKGWQKSLPAMLASSLVHPPLLPEVSGQPDEELRELDLHNHTIYSWIRRIYGKDHFRIEFRMLPAGPTAPDMAANSAFIIGLTLALRAFIADWIKHGLPSQLTRQNFYAAARDGLDAELLWPTTRKTALAYPARKLVLKLLPLAEAALQQAGVDHQEVKYYLDIIEQRVTSGKTGAAWLIQAHEKTRGPTAQRMQAITREYLRLSQNGQGLPVHTW